MILLTISSNVEIIFKGEWYDDMPAATFMY